MVGSSFTPHLQSLFPSCYPSFHPRDAVIHHFKSTHWSDPLPCRRHCVRHKWDTEVMQSWCPASWAQCSWGTIGTLSSVVWVEPPWFRRSTAWPHLPAHHSPNWRAAGSALWQIWEFEALIQEVFQSTVCFVCPCLSWNLLSLLVLISSGFGPRLVALRILQELGVTVQQGRWGQMWPAVWPVGPWAVGHRQS